MDWNYFLIVFHVLYFHHLNIFRTGADSVILPNKNMYFLNKNLLHSSSSDIEPRYKREFSIGAGDSDGHLQTHTHLGQGRQRRSMGTKTRNSDHENDSTMPIVKQFTFDKPKSDKGGQGIGWILVHWIGQNLSEKIIVLTFQYVNREQFIGSTVWRSDDNGATFSSEEEKFPTNNISNFFTFPSNRHKLLFVDHAAQKVYTTDDELDHVQNYSLPAEPDMIVPHPTDDNKLLLYNHKKKEIYVSVDFAASWTRLAENASPRFYWGDPVYDKDPNIVHMEVQESKDFSSYMSCIVPKCDKMENLNQDMGPHLTYSLHVHKEYMFVKQLNFNETEAYLLVSYKRGPFKKAYFPGGLKTENFRVLNLDDGQVFVAVKHGQVVNLYLSDVTGQFYVLSLPNVYFSRDSLYQLDFDEVRGMNWTFIANVREKKTTNVTTYISYDKGGNWAPLKTNKELKATCKQSKTCKLQLHLTNSIGYRASILMSSRNAPGVIIAHGSLDGPGENGSLAVFTSRDGGLTWNKAPLPGELHLFNILDQGGVITAVKSMFANKTKVLHYSLDEGLTWKEIEFNEKPLAIEVAGTEPGSLTSVLSIFSQENYTAPWTMFQLNFSSVLGRQCQSKDYVKWKVEDYNSKSKKECVLGKITEYTRRDVKKPPCYSGGVLKPNVNTKSCDCSIEDYECDFGYEESERQCKKLSWFYDGYIAFECKDNNYNASQGYRKIPADTCSENPEFKKKYDRVAKECPSVPPQGLTLTTLSVNVQRDKQTDFHIDQRGGPKTGTTYTWDFYDGTAPKVLTNFASASKVSHTFEKSGHYNVSVKAVSPKTKGFATDSISVHVQDQIHWIYIGSPWASILGMPVKLTAHGSYRSYNDDVHYVWNFDDEPANEHPLLTWNSSVTHVFKSARTYKVKVEAVNSIGSLYTYSAIRIFSKGVILLIKFDVVQTGQHRTFYDTSDTNQIRQDISQALGVSTLRFECVDNNAPQSNLLYIFPSDQPEDATETMLAERIKTMVKNKEFVISHPSKELFGKNQVVRIVSATEWTFSPTDGPSSPSSSGPNMKPVYIAVPVLLLAVAVSISAICYCRRRTRASHRFSLLSVQDDSDALLDDDDEGPLDLNIDLGMRVTGRDDDLLSSD